MFWNVLDICHLPPTPLPNRKTQRKLADEQNQIRNRHSLCNNFISVI